MRPVFAKLILATVLPLALFALLEIGLRVAGFGTSLDFLVPEEGRGVYRTNPHFTELFYPASFGLKPVNLRLTKEKAPGTYRIFVLGESAAMGVPEPAFALSRQLEAQLERCEPRRKIEVFNFGVTAINSHAILQILRQAVRFDPDLLVIYMGNNEVLGPFGPGSGLAARTYPRWLVKSGLWIGKTRIAQLLRWALGVAGRPVQEWRGMEMFTRNAVEAGDPRLERTYANFEGNLDEMLAIAREAGVKVVISTVAVNVRDCAPFVSRHRQPLSASQMEAWNRSLAGAARALDLGNRDQARLDFEHALAIDSSFADTHFRLARLLDEQGDLPGARRHYLAALQLDALRFRADSRINDTIRRVAASYPSTAMLVDAAKELGSDKTSSVQPAGADLFFEHVHFRWEGNYALARLIAPAVWAGLSRGNARPSAWRDRAECAAFLGYTELGQHAMARSMATLTGRPPFTGQSSYAEDRTRLLKEIAALEAKLAGPGAIAAVVAKVEAALQRAPTDPRLLFQAAAARILVGDYKRSLELNDQFRSRVPFSPVAVGQRAYLLHRLGRDDEAEDLLLESARADPFCFQTHKLLFELWVSTHQFSRALGYFAGLAARMPERAGSLYAELLARSGDWPAAERQWRAVLQRVPDDESALGPLLHHFQKSNDPQSTLELLHRAHAYNPRNSTNNSRLARIYEAKGDSGKAAFYLNALAESGPVNARHYLALAAHLGKLGQKEPFAVALARGKRVAESVPDKATLRQLEETTHPGGR